jgi:hypothetical protein
MEPPWKVFDYPQLSLGWRMGAGEDYRDEWYEWFRQLSREEQRSYIFRYPEPEDWFGFYDLYLASNQEERTDVVKRADRMREEYLEQQYKLAVQHDKAGNTEQALDQLEKVILEYYDKTWYTDAIVRYVALKRRLAEEMAQRKTIRDSWKILEHSTNRERIEMQRTLTPEEYEHIKRGIIPSDYKHQWIIYFEHDTLYIHRHWKEPCYFLITFHHDNQSYRIDGAWVNTQLTSSEQSSEYRKALLNRLIEQILEYSQWA